MHAIHIERDSLTWRETDEPVPGVGEVVVDVAAAGVNRADLLQRRGAYPPPPGASEVLGLEVSGTIRALGQGVSGWKVGEQVCALLAGGGYAEQVAVPTVQLLHVPRGVSVVDAAALPEAACTVWSTLFAAARLSAGETVLIHGGTGGIGTFAIQLCTALGARVAVTGGTDEGLRRCAELGADLLINYRDRDFADVIGLAGGADVILDVVGAKYLDRNVAALRTGGRLVVIGLQGGTRAELDLGAVLAKRITVLGATLRSRPVSGPGSKAEIVARVRQLVWPLVEAGRIRPVVGARLPLPDAEQAHALLDGPDAPGGKILLLRPDAV